MQISPIQQNNTSFRSSVDLINTIPSQKSKIHNQSKQTKHSCNLG